MSELLPEGVNASQCVLILSATSDSASASNELFLTPFKDARLPSADPTVTMEVVAGDDPASAVVHLSSRDVVPLLTLSTSLDGRFEDNGLLLLPGMPRSIRFFGYEAFSVEALVTSLRATSPVRPLMSAPARSGISV